MLGIHASGMEVSNTGDSILPVNPQSRSDRIAYCAVYDFSAICIAYGLDMGYLGLTDGLGKFYYAKCKSEGGLKGGANMYFGLHTMSTLFLQTFYWLVNLAKYSIQTIDSFVLLY